MLNQNDEDKFNEMMQYAYEEQKDRLGGIPDGHEGEPQLIAINVEDGRTLRKIKAQTHILECAFQTDEYLGYLKCSEALARLNDNSFLAGFYKGKYDKFIFENTP